MTATLYGLARIGWELITGMPVNSRVEALKKLNWYAMRWKIEALYKNLNRGAGQNEADSKIRPFKSRKIRHDV